MPLVSGQGLIDSRVRGFEFIPPGAEVVIANERAIVLRWEDAYIGVWTGGVGHEDLDAVEAYLGRYGKPVMGFVAVAADAPVPEAELRTRLSKFSYDEAYFAGSVLVYRGSGLRASIIRSVMTGIGMTVRKAIPSQVTGDADDALTWAREQSPRMNLPLAVPRLINSILDARDSTRASA